MRNLTNHFSYTYGLFNIFNFQVELGQPVFGANFIKGKVRAQPNGNWIGEAKFKIMFKAGGAIDFGEGMLRAARMGNYLKIILIYYKLY